VEVILGANACVRVLHNNGRSFLQTNQFVLNLIRERTEEVRVRSSVEISPDPRNRSWALYSAATRCEIPLGLEF
jgi:hypothetical protein